MMTRYLLRHLIAGTVLVTAGLLCILWLTQSLRFVELIVTQGLSIGSFLALTGLLLPNFLAIVLPISLFGVVLFTYNRLAGDRELIVLRAAGVGPFGLARAAFVLAAVTTVVVFSITLHFGPLSARSFKEMQWTIRNDMSRILIQEGAFSQVARGLTIYVRSQTPNGELLSIMANDDRRPNVTVTVLAERGALVEGPNGMPRVILGNGSRMEVERGTGRLSLLNFDTYTMDLTTSESNTGPRFREAPERDLQELFSLKIGDEQITEQSQVLRFRAEAHQRLATPLSAITFTLIALAVLLNGSFNRRGSGSRLVIAITLMVLCESLIIGAGNAAAKSAALIPLIYIAVLLPILPALIALLKPGLFMRQRRLSPLNESSGQEAS